MDTYRVCPIKWLFLKNLPKKADVTDLLWLDINALPEMVT